MPLPDFIIIGAMKSGTSTLHSNLQLHPDIGMSKLKEPHFFDLYYDKGIEWYKDQFQDKRVLGESTPAYTWQHIYPEVPGRMATVIPDAKLIYLLRDPIARIESHLHHDLYRGRLKLKEIDSKVLEDPQYIQTSRYFFQLKEYLKYFPKERILIMETNELKKDLNSSLNEICSYLNVDSFDFTNKVKVRNQSARKYLIPGYDTVHKYFPRQITKLYHLFFYFRNKKIERPKLKEETLIEIKRRLSPDIEELKKFSGKNFDDWKKYNSII